MPWVSRPKFSGGLKGRESRGSYSAEHLAAFQAALVCFVPFSQGIGLRPQKPWAKFSRPVGPALVDALIDPERLESVAIPPD